MKAAIRKHWGRVAARGCVVCGADAEISHSHGGSIVERMQEPKARGKKLDRLDYLVLPLCPLHHRLGPPGTALDVGVDIWEANHGLQSDHIDRLCIELGVDIWAKAMEGRK